MHQPPVGLATYDGLRIDCTGLGVPCHCCAYRIERPCKRLDIIVSWVTMEVSCDPNLYRVIVPVILCLVPR